MREKRFINFVDSFINFIDTVGAPHKCDQQKHVSILHTRPMVVTFIFLCYAKIFSLN